MQPARETSPDDKQSPGGEIPPLTAWAKARYDLEKPGYGKRAAPGGNDPILQCDPMGFPRILYFPTPFEFMQVSNRVLQMFERDHVVREIWTDGRALPSDPDPLWYGYSSGKWVDDATFVVESTGYDDRTWLGAAGFPHSETMHLEERYQRVDRDTINFTLTITTRRPIPNLGSPCPAFSNCALAPKSARATAWRPKRMPSPSEFANLVR